MKIIKISSSLAFCNYLIFRETYSKYFSISERDISSVTHKSSTWSSFAGILYIFNLCNKSLYLKQIQSAFIKSNWWFFLRHTRFVKFYFVKFWTFEKNKFWLLLKVNVPFLFQCEKIFQPLAHIWWTKDILIVFLVKICCKNKLFIRHIVILCKNLCKNVILRRHICIFIQITLKLSLEIIVHLK